MDGSNLPDAGVLVRPRSRRARSTAVLALPLLAMLASCTSVVAGTPRAMSGVVVERPLDDRARAELADAVLAGHAALSSMSRTTVHRDPISTDRFRVVEERVGDRVDRVLTYTPTSTDVWSIEEIRCVDRRAFATPPPDDVSASTPWVEVPIDPEAPETPDDPTEAWSGFLIAAACDYGYPQDLAYDVTFLAEAREIVDLGEDAVDGVPVRRYRVELDTVDSAGSLVGLGWVYDDSLAGDVDPTTVVDITVDAQGRLRTLGSTVAADGVEYGDSIVFSGFDVEAAISAPDPAEVSTP